MPDEPDLFGATKTPPATPAGGLLSPYLVNSAHGAKAAGLALTRPGMAGIADPGRGASCRECLYWDGAGGDKRDAWGDLQAAICHKYCQLARVTARQAAKDRKLPATCCACNHFEPNPRPPAMGRNG
jgi:hypothetical protein